MTLWSGVRYRRPSAILASLCLLALGVVWANAPDDGEPARGKVVVFLDPGCPIARFHTATLRDCHQVYAGKGIHFEAYVPRATATEAAVERFVTKYELPFPVSADARQERARLHEARTVPEVFVYDARDKLVYRGRIDDTFIGIGKRRPKTRAHDLRDALQALTRGQLPTIQRTQAIGCAITFRTPK